MALDDGRNNDNTTRARTDAEASSHRRRKVDIHNPDEVIDHILGEMDCDNHFMRSVVHTIAARQLNSGAMTLEAIVIFIRFQGIEAFCQTYGKQNEIPTRPHVPSPDDLRKLTSPDEPKCPAIDDAPPSPRSRRNPDLLTNLQNMKSKIEKALQEGTESSGSPITDEVTDLNGRYRMAK